jgi:hypothetical protein
MAHRQASGLASVRCCRPCPMILFRLSWDFRGRSIPRCQSPPASKSSETLGAEPSPQWVGLRASGRHFGVEDPC